MASRRPNVVSRRDLQPFGEDLAADQTFRKTTDQYSTATQDKVRQRFTGYLKDIETGLDFAEARMYENRHGRFTAVDPLLASGKSANPQTFNRYTYVLNSPLVNTDPTGLQTNQPTPYRLRPPRIVEPPNARRVVTDPGRGLREVDFFPRIRLEFVQVDLMGVDHFFRRKPWHISGVGTTARLVVINTSTNSEVTDYSYKILPARDQGLGYDENQARQSGEIGEWDLDGMDSSPSPYPPDLDGREYPQMPLELPICGFNCTEPVRSINDAGESSVFIDPELTIAPPSRSGMRTMNVYIEAGQRIHKVSVSVYFYTDNGNAYFEIGEATTVDDDFWWFPNVVEREEF